MGNESAKQYREEDQNREKASRAHKEMNLNKIYNKKEHYVLIASKYSQ